MEAILVIVSYLIGSIPTAVWISKKKFGIDIREYGSGNAGATNTFRVLGKQWGIIVLLIDLIKGVIATSLYVFMPFYLSPDHEIARVNFMIILGLTAVLGHVFPIWANFKGGKGVATLFGMAIAIQPLVAICCVGVFIVFLYMTRFVSLSSILASISFMLFVVFIFDEKEFLYRAFAIFVCVLICFTHQKNIVKLLQGKESKAGIMKFRDEVKKNKK
ncbi:MAG: glycerol-3-phosphate 1-O-acyltransferase PlsY [Phycisphaerales bacterium]|nr:glycerol-3-phosphate 1-O-acyltransferase PlsY [Phycisphaerales bacterium]